MKGLLMKDFCVFTRKMKTFFLLMMVFAAVPNGSMVGFAVMYSGMLPITAVSYDENSKWDELAAMMPYSVFQMVFSKYALGYLLTLGAAVGSFVIHSIVGYFAHTLTATFPAELTVYICISFVITALDLPIILRFGAEKGRLVFLFLTVAIVVFCVNSIEYLITLFDSIDAGSIMFLPVFLGAAVLVNAVSIPLAMRSYRKRFRR